MYFLLVVKVTFHYFTHATHEISGHTRYVRKGRNEYQIVHIFLGSQVTRTSASYRSPQHDSILSIYHLLACSYELLKELECVAFYLI